MMENEHMTEKHVPFTVKYDPKTLDDVILDEEQRALLKSYVDKGSIPNMTLAGRPGIGKTTLCRVLTQAIDASVLFICGSQETGVDTVRTKIENFASAAGFCDSQKVVVIDEADGMASTSAAQKALRNTITQHEKDTVFLFTCNDVGAISPAIKSRCRPFVVKYGLKDVLKRALKIMADEGVEITNDVKRATAHMVNSEFPDVRSIVTMVERYCMTGSFTSSTVVKEEELSIIFDQVVEATKSSPRNARKYYISHSSDFGSDYVELVRYFMKRFEDPIEQLICGMFHYRIANVIDGEIQFYTMLLVLFNYWVNNVDPTNVMEFK
jgi:DNA polymerase III delta prime subunit